MKQWRFGVLFIRTGRESLETYRVHLDWFVLSDGVIIICFIHWVGSILWTNPAPNFLLCGSHFCFLHFNTITFPFLAINSFCAFSIVNPNLKSHLLPYLNYTCLRLGFQLQFCVSTFSSSPHLPYSMFPNLMNFLHYCWMLSFNVYPK